MGVAALVLGLVGVMVCWFPLIGWGGIALALLAFAVGVVAIKKGVKGLGIAGLLLGLIGVLWGLSVQIQYISAVSGDAQEQQLEEAGPEPERAPREEREAREPEGEDRL